MTIFDTIFNNACIEAGFTQYIVYSNKDRDIKTDRHVTSFPALFRQFTEELRPLFDEQQRYERNMVLYCAHVGFIKATPEDISVNLEDIMDKFVVFREYLRRHNIQVEFTNSPFPQWEVTKVDDYGYVFNLKLTYPKACLHL